MGGKDILGLSTYECHLGGFIYTVLCDFCVGLFLGLSFFSMGYYSDNQPRLDGFSHFEEYKPKMHDGEDSTNMDDDDKPRVIQLYDGGDE